MQTRDHRPALAALLAAALLGPAGARPAAQGASPLTIEQAVAEALARNDRLANQHDLVTQAGLAVRLAESGFRPKVTPNIFGSFGRTDVTSQTYRVDVTEKLQTGTELRLSVGTASNQIPSDAGGDVLFYNADTTLTVTQPLLRGFGRAVARRALTAAELQRDDATRLQVMAEQQVALDVASAYYRVVAQQALALASRQSLDRARRLRDAAEAKLDAGLVSQLDVLRAQQLVAQAETQLFDAQSAIEDGRDRLAFLMGRDGGAAFDVAAAIPRPDVEPIDADLAVTTALGNRADLKVRAAAADDADARLRYSRNQLLPQVDVHFSLTRRGTASSLSRSFGLDGFQYATFVTIAMPVDRTAQQVEYQSAVLDRDRRRRDAATLERQIANDVRQAIREQARLVRNVLSAETSVELGRREVDVARMRFETGLSNNLDVVTAEAGWLAAEGRRIQALADAAVARLRLRALIGILNPRLDVKDAE